MVLSIGEERDHFGYDVIRDCPVDGKNQKPSLVDRLKSMKKTNKTIREEISMGDNVVDNQNELG